MSRCDKCGSKGDCYCDNPQREVSDSINSTNEILEGILNVLKEIRDIIQPK